MVIVMSSNYSVRLTSYNKMKHHVISSVDIDCRNYETFKKVVDVVKPILEEEERVGKID